MKKTMKPLKLKRILPYLNPMTRCVIYQGDIFTKGLAETDDEWEEIFKGHILDIPWYIIEYYLINDPKTWDEAIDARLNDDEKDAILIITVVEDKKYVNAAGE